HRDDAGMDGDALPRLERQRLPLLERDAGRLDVADAFPVEPPSAREREGDVLLLVAPPAEPPEPPSVRPAVPPRRRGAAVLRHPAGRADRGEVDVLPVEADPVPFHRDPGRRIEPVGAVLAADARGGDPAADEPALRGRVGLGDLDAFEPPWLHYRVGGL